MKKKQKLMNINKLNFIFSIVNITIIIFFFAFIITLYNEKMLNVMTGTKWNGSSFNIIMLIQECIYTVIPYIIFILVSNSIIKRYQRKNNVKAKLSPFNILLIFVIILLINILIQLVLTKSSSVVINDSLTVKEVFFNLGQLKGFSTGLDMFIPIENLPSMIVAIIKNINVFSALAFTFLYFYLNREKSSNLKGVFILIIVIFLSITTIFGMFDMSGIIQWN